MLMHCAVASYELIGFFLKFLGLKKTKHPKPNTAVIFFFLYLIMTVAYSKNYK